MFARTILYFITFSIASIGIFYLLGLFETEFSSTSDYIAATIFVLTLLWVSHQLAKD